MKAEHPMDPLLAVPKELRDAISYNLLSPDYVIASERARFLSSGQEELKRWMLMNVL